MNFNAGSIELYFAQNITQKKLLVTYLRKFGRWVNAY